jgi:hypothetical protein
MSSLAFLCLYKEASHVNKISFMDLLYHKELLYNIGDGSTYAILLDLSKFLCNILDYVQCRRYRFLLLVVSDELDRIE